jgi:hypothetical protein
VSPDDDWTLGQGSDSGSDSDSDSDSDEDDALTRELKRIDAESDAVEEEFDAEDGALDVRDDEEFRGLIWAFPGLARLMVKAWLRTVVWGGRTSVRVSLRLGHAAVDPRATVALARDVSSGLRLYAREFLGISDLEQRVEQADPGRSGPPAAASQAVSPLGAGRRALARRRESDDRSPPPEASLRMRGAQLLRESADVSADDRTHPAYARILAELAPDEGRILRLLAAEGPQPTVDVRALNLIGVGSQLVADHMSMIGPEAGCRHVERMPEYLINLQRLALIEFADDPIDDPSRYQVVEAQPEVLGAIKRASRAKTVHRSLRLTQFGQKFCDVCLPLDRDEVEELTDDTES